MELQKLPVAELRLDLRNFRTTPQPDEAAAVRAMLVKGKAQVRFFALLESLVENGVLSNENIIVLKSGENADVYEVKEGNRRVAAVKIILGEISSGRLGIPAELKEKITNLRRRPKWREGYKLLSCVVYEPNEADTVNRIVALTHGRGELSGRADWSSVAKARYDREMKGEGQLDLDLLEAYLEHGRNLTSDDREVWSGEYPLTVLAEALPRLAKHLKYRKRLAAFVKAYPQKIAHREKIEAILFDIGKGDLNFPTLRETSDIFSSKYQLPLSTDDPSEADTAAQSESGAGQSNSSAVPSSDGASSGSSGAAAGGEAAGPGNPTNAGNSGPRTRPAATPVGDPRTVAKALKKVVIRGSGRAKAATMLDELKTIDLVGAPHGFCLVLRSIFELLAKAYCEDHNIRNRKPDGTDIPLVDVLRNIHNHLIRPPATPGGAADKKYIEMKKQLSAAMSELAKTDGFLSVYSMNQIVHNPNFAVTAIHISTVFSNILPLLSALSAPPAATEQPQTPPQPTP